MIKKFKLLIILFLLTSFNTANARDTGPATEYKMTIHKLELCATGSTIGAMTTGTWNCIDSVDVSGGSVGTAIDIGSAAIGIGEAAATLGDFGKAKTGVTYTHIITTLSREIQITGGTDDCSTAGDGTLAANINAGSAGNGASAPNTTTAVSSKLFVPVMTGQDAKLRSVSDVAGSNPQLNGKIIAAHEFFQTIGSIGTFTLNPGQIPTVTMAFGTLQAVAAKDETDCTNSSDQMQAAAPTAILTLQGQ